MGPETQHEAQTRKKLGVRTPICRCQPVNPKHTTMAHCVTPAELAAWRAKHPESLASERTQRILAALDIEYGPTITFEQSEWLHRETGT